MSVRSPAWSALLLAAAASSALSQEVGDRDSGERLAALNCAQCHLDDDSEAPQLDEADDWDLRTYLWAAVMKDHANNGFLRMPAKGGHAALTSQNINDALYYMEVKIKALQ